MKTRYRNRKQLSRNQLARHLQACQAETNILKTQLQIITNRASRAESLASQMRFKNKELQERLDAITAPIIRHFPRLNHYPTEAEMKAKVWQFTGTFSLGVTVDVGCVKILPSHGSPDALLNEIAHSLAELTYKEAMAKLRILTS